MKLFVGLDVSSEKLDACFMTDCEELSVLKEAVFENSHIGASQIKEIILDISAKLEIEKVTIGMEATSLYSFHPSMFFKEDEELNQLNLTVSIEQPAKVKKYRDVFEENKNDQIDAYYIADYLRVQRYSSSIVKEEKYIALQHLTRTRYQLIKQLVRTKQHFIENVYYKCNTLAKEIKTEGISVLSATLVTLMTDDYTMDQLAEMPLEDFANLIQKLGKHRFRNPEKTASAISTAVRGSYRLGQVHQNSVNIVLSVLAKEIRSSEKLVKQLDKAINDLVVVLPEYQCLTSVPGIGPVYAAGILAEIGQIQRFENETKVAKYAGLYWRTHQSGNTSYQNTPMAKRGNRYLRYYLVEAANSVRRNEPVYKAYYNKKYDDTPKHKHKRAIVLTARKFVRLVDTLLRNHQLYMPPRSVIDK